MKATPEFHRQTPLWATEREDEGGGEGGFSDTNEKHWKMATGCYLNAHFSHMCCREIAHWQAIAKRARPGPVP